MVIIPDMEFQKKFKAQGATELFEDQRTMRTPPTGTVARGTLKEDTAFFFGHVDGDTISYNPRPITMELLQRGQQRYNIACAPCHDQTGGGKGIVVGYGLVPPPPFHDQRIRESTEGHIFNVITHGIRNMPSYRVQISAGDRWAIVAYVRALQRSGNATLGDVPSDARSEFR